MSDGGRRTEEGRGSTSGRRPGGVRRRGPGRPAARVGRAAAGVLAASLAWGGPVGAARAGAQEADGPTLRGFGPAAARAEADVEAWLRAEVWPDTVGRYARGLAGRPHVAGTPAQAATRDSVLAWLRAAGLEAEADTLVLYLPMPLEVSVTRTAPTPLRLDPGEEPIADDPLTTGPIVPVFNAFSGSGTAEGELVFAHFGLPADYAHLDSIGVSVRGRVVLARYGRSFRGIKAREAEARGAAALLMYSDPADDGYGRGDVYPVGPMRPASGVQRGSILNASGDPTTPDGPSVPGASRLPPERLKGVSGIPVVPIGYGQAVELLAPLGGSEAPAGWQGRLPIRYHVGPGPTAVRVTVRTEAGEDAYHPAFNTLAWVRGTDWPDEWIIVGGHRDAWGPGAIDNASGSSSVIAAARAFAGLAARGIRPRRSVLFATWDAEEWGLMGSVEWVEGREGILRERAVAYVNQDAVVSGPNFGGAASPELKALVREAASAVPDPAGGTVRDRWAAAAAAAARARGSEPPRSLGVGNLGGGSDHKPFYQHLGIPSAGFGFGGRSGVYHSAYDSPRWMERFGDPGYRYHATVARIVAVAAARLANADILPYDHVEMASTLEDLVMRLEAEMDSLGLASDGASLEALRGATRTFAEEAAAFGRARDAALAETSPGADVLRGVNAELRRVGPTLTAPSGMPGDPWSRQLLFASDPDNGYATLPLPAIRVSLRERDPVAVSEGIETLARRVRAAAEHLVAARRALGD
ncbi:MAG: M20/M25/M40 family metallo-hydrolase [Gemmatimonadota bacterium]